MNGREIISRVLDFSTPQRIGLAYSAYDGRPRICDTAGVGPSPDPNFQAREWEDEQGGECHVDEWGCVWRRLKGKTLGGEVIQAPLQSWEDLDTYKPPTLDDPARYRRAAEVCEKTNDRYVLGSIAGCCFNAARYLRRLENYLLDCAAEPENIRRLNTMVSDLILRQVDIYADIGAQGVFFCEDWGTQERLLVSPTMWHDLFRPTFERLVQRAHSRGLTVWMHSCGYVRDIIPSLVEIGVDVLQFDQPELHGLDWLRQFSGKVTFWCPIDIQTVLQCGEEGTIKAKAREMVRKLGRGGGGFIAKDYPDNHSIGCDPIWQHWGYEEFLRVGRYAADGTCPAAAE